MHGLWREIARSPRPERHPSVSVAVPAIMAEEPAPGRPPVPPVPGRPVLEPRPRPWPAPRSMPPSSPAPVAVTGPLAVPGPSAVPSVHASSSPALPSPQTVLDSVPRGGARRVSGIATNWRQQLRQSVTRDKPGHRLLKRPSEVFTCSSLSSKSPADCT